MAEITGAELKRLAERFRGRDPRALPREAREVLYCPCGHLWIDHTFHETSERVWIECRYLHTQPCLKFEELSLRDLAQISMEPDHG